ncbi:hypothetical protein, partial [Streptomyces sp. CBMA123]|uniref:hypothetical protein n=1 Tax=Streptomyces sp. CBMA123 TaxID=1896313 RepID=UPI001CB84015
MRCLGLRGLPGLLPRGPLRTARLLELRCGGAGPARLVRRGPGLLLVLRLRVPGLLAGGVGRAGRQRHRLLTLRLRLGLLLRGRLRLGRVRHARQHRLHQAEAQRVTRVDLAGLEARPGELLGGVGWEGGGVGR